jgi:acetyl-CoA synthetase
MSESHSPLRDVGPFTQSVERALSLLREVAARGHRGARLTDLVADSGFPKPTVRRLLATMIRESFIEQDEQTRRYYLGADAFVLGTIAAARFGIHKLPAGPLSRLAAMSYAKYSGNAIPLAALLCDRHADVGRDSAVALVHENAAGRTARLTYVELMERSKRFASVLKSLGVAKGQRIATLLPKGPELLIAVVALWRLGAVHVPLFTAFGAEAISYRLADSNSCVVITNGTFRNRIADDISASTRVITVESEGAATAWRGDVFFWSALHAAQPIDTVTELAGDDPFLLVYTTGAADAPKGVPIPVRALASIEEYMRLALDVRDDDVYWNTADAGWAYGIWFAIIGPLLLGQSTLLYDGPFDAARIYRILTKHGVTNLAAAPSWYNALRAADDDFDSAANLRLRVASSAGEPLSAEVVRWALERLGVPLHNHYGQTELGMVVANHHAPALQRPLRSGSIGQPMPGFRVVIIDARGREAPPEQKGEIAIDTEKSPLFWFSGYHNDPAHTAERFRHGRRYYMTGDLASMYADGDVYYLGPAEDVIGSAGYTVGPTEIEDVLASHAAVSLAAVVAKPDRLRGEVVKIFIVLKEGHVPTSELAQEIAERAKSRLAADAYPPEVEFVTTLPRTPKSKLHRAVLRERGPL